MSNIQRIQFHEDDLQVIVDEQTGKEYVLPKPIVEMFGLSWQGQLAKLSKGKLFSHSIKKIFIETAAGQREIVALERRMIHPWLLSISVERVSPTLQEKLLRYQEECADVLDAHFSKAANLPKVYDSRTEIAIQTLVRLDAAEHRIAVMERTDHERQEALIAMQAQTIEALQRANEANMKATMVLEEQAWMTIRQYVIATKSEREMPESLQRQYATFLVGYCMQEGHPVYPVPIAYQRWKDENSYYLGDIKATLPGWLARHNGQTILNIVPKKGAS